MCFFFSYDLYVVSVTQLCVLGKGNDNPGAQLGGKFLKFNTVDAVFDSYKPVF